MFKRQLKKKKETLKRKHETVQRKADEQSVLSANKGIRVLIGSMPFEWRQNEFNMKVKQGKVI